MRLEAIGWKPHQLLDKFFDGNKMNLPCKRTFLKLVTFIH